MPDIVTSVLPTMPERLPPGTGVDRHVLDSVLRDGGMATIYLGHHRTTNARVAIKVLHTDYVHQPDFVARFDREALVMGRLSGCPQIVSVHDVGSLPDGRRYLVMDLVRGHDLRDELDQLAGRDEPMEVARAVSLMRDVAAGLSAAHQMDVVHRDIKPSNIMLESSAGREVAKVLDFGISADLAETGRSQDLTAGGTVIGTAQYMSPEQAAGISDAETVDIWAMGVLLLEMLTGRAPPKAGWGLRGASLEGLPPIPAELHALLEGMLQTDSTRRIQSAREVEAGLISILPTLGLDVSMVSAPILRPQTAQRGGTDVVPAPKKGPSLRPALWGVAAAAVIVLGSMTGWWLVRPHAMAPKADQTVVLAENGEEEPPAAESKEVDASAAAATPEPGPAVSPKAEPEPDAAADPEVSPEPKPRTPPSPPRAKKGKPRPSSPPSKKPAKDCAAVRQETVDAALLGEWRTVLKHTKGKACWSAKKTQRERHRVRALHKLGKYAQCEREGQESGDPTVWSIVELCRSHGA
ncbi:MAG: protein kinase domain-containing protein [Nannocystales bacterium]